MAAYTALFDACVLYRAPLRDLLMHLAVADLFRARWTARIHDEWMRNLRANRPDLDPEKIARTRELMDENARDAIITDFEHLIPSVELPDPGDRRVVAAAIRGRADVIVTYNLKDFPKECLGLHGLEAQHPDEFLSHQFGVSVEIFVGAAKRHRASLRWRPPSPEAYLLGLQGEELVETVAQLSRFIGLI